MEKYRIHKDWTYHKEGEEKKHKITLPHDAMIYEKRRPDLENGGATGFFPGGTYIYEKDLFGEQAFAKKTVLLEFEGIYQHSTVYLNEEKLGGWLYGYTNFYVDLTGKLRVGEDNHLKVVADNSKTPNSRWYSGSGIYRPVNLWIGEEDCILPEQIQVKTVSIEPAVVEIMVKEETEPNMPASAAGSRGKAFSYFGAVLYARISKWQDTCGGDDACRRIKAAAGNSRGLALERGDAGDIYVGDNAVGGWKRHGYRPSAFRDPYVELGCREGLSGQWNAGETAGRLRPSRSRNSGSRCLGSGGGAENPGHEGTGL